MLGSRSTKVKLPRPVRWLGLSFVTLSSILVVSPGWAQGGPGGDAVPSACQPKAVIKARGEFKKAYKKAAFARAGQVLSQLLDRCGDTLNPQLRDSLRNDLALTRHHQGDQAGCLAALQPLQALARRSDDQIRTETASAPETTAEQLRLANATRFNLGMCSRPLLEDKPGMLIGQMYDSAEQLDPSLFGGGGGVLSSQSTYAIEVFRMARWRTSNSSPEKILYVLADLRLRSEKSGPAKVLDVLFIDAGKFPAGAMQNGDYGPVCKTATGQEDVIGVFPSENADKGVKPFKAWLADAKTGKFVPLAPASVTCTFEYQYGEGLD